ncbi:MAG: GWxTD domain-containing protein [Bacteroidota bacterium]
MRNFLIILLFNLVPGLSLLLAQDVMPAVPAVFEPPKFYLDVINYSGASPESTQFDIFLQVPYRMLSFIKEDETFRASYDVTINIFDSTNALIAEKLWTEKVETHTYDESISKQNGTISERTLYVTPGSFQLLVQVRDNESKKYAEIKRAVKVRRFSRSHPALSDLMVVGAMNKEDEKTAIVPNVSAYIGEQTGIFSIFYEAYKLSTIDSGLFVLSVRNLNGDILRRDTLRQHLSRERNSCFINVASENLATGNYEMEVKGIPFAANAAAAVSDSFPPVKRMFTVKGKGLPAPIIDLDAAIDELLYIADRDTLEKMKKADPATKKNMFLAFWKRRDPNPNTEVNELMEEYYSRVDYANKNFGHYLPGWKSDRGMVFIIFGAPSNVERRSMNMDSNGYEIWTYFEQNREFVFIDQSGFGDYRLQTPLWDVGRGGRR